MTDLHVVLGASGGAGNAITHALHEAGLQVRAVSRSGDADVPAPVERMAADITSRDGVRRALAGADVVYLAAQPPYDRWLREFPPMLARVIDAVPGGARLVMVDNLYGYGPGSSPITESSPQNATDTKGRVRRSMAQTLQKTHRAGRIRVVIGRASDYIGPGPARSAITALAIDPVSTGGRLRWPGSLDAPHSVAYLPDVARAYVLLGTRSEADGRVWILPHAPAVTGREFLALVNAALPQPRKTGVISTTMMRLAAPFNRDSREMLDIAYQWSEPFVADHSAFFKAFGPLPLTPIPDAVRATVAARLSPDGAGAP
jgi:nucleoside-diphosphate-sugar epimerase